MTLLIVMPEVDHILPEGFKLLLLLVGPPLDPIHELFKCILDLSNPDKISKVK
jgi:hypothetical protein